ncbi:MAG TPA: GAF domain-containing SpoIIE family protein phosphatase [Thermoanaerobaculia bacterium]|nr:GAF domain-containing SpoIIE family protein phosphatase [Thermoanaerobaculia bacterium]
MHDEHEERIRELLLIQRVAQRISSILDLDRLLEEILSDVCRTFGYSRLTVWLKDDATDELVLHGWSGTHYSEGDRFRIGIDGIVGHVGVTLKPYYAPNVLVDPYYRLSEEQSRSELAVPLLAGGRLIGIFDIEDTEIDAFPPARIQLLEALAGHVATAIENARLFRQERLEKERMAGELREARGIQTGLFPTQAPETSSFAIESRCIPCREVGGDWFDYLPLDDGRFGVTVADVSGKGLAAALLMSSARSILRLLAEDGRAPGEVLRRINRTLLKDLPAARFVTMIYAVLEPARRRLVFANAGHPYPLLVDSAGGRFLPTEAGFPLGIREGPFAEREVELPAGSRLLFYSDGLPEAMSPAEEEYGTERIRRHFDSESATVESLLEDVRGFVSGAPAADDLTAVLIRATG